MSHKFIGGFFGLDLDLCEERVKDSVWSRWTKDVACSLSFKNARSAMAYLFDQKASGKVWFPSYICRDIPAGEQSCGFYPADPVHGVDLAFLERHAASGDAVVLVNYFGAAPQPDILDFISKRSDILWVEDRCHSLWSETPVYGDWVIYSPRKLLGVQDGGVLVSYKEELPAPDYETEKPSGPSAARLRYEDPAQENSDIWYEAYKRSEVEMSVSLQPMSKETQKILKTLPISELIERRQINAATLRGSLEDSGGFTILEYGDVPFCVAILLDDKQAMDIQAKMADVNIFCARHWADLAADARAFPQSHELAGKLLSLPCDHRYDAEDMSVVAQNLKAILSKNVR